MKETSLQFKKSKKLKEWSSLKRLEGEADQRGVKYEKHEYRKQPFYFEEDDKKEHEMEERLKRFFWRES